MACWQPERLADFLELWEHFAAAEGREAPNHGDAVRGRGPDPQMTPRPSPTPSAIGADQSRAGPLFPVWAMGSLES